MGLGTYRQCKLPWLFCKEIHNPQRLSRSNAPAQKTEQNTRVLDPSPGPPEVGGCLLSKTEWPLSLLCPPCSLLSQGVPTARYKFYLFSVQESREEAASQLSACPSPRTPIKGTNWTAIHQSRSQEWVLGGSARNPLVGLLFQIEKYRRRRK